MGVTDEESGPNPAALGTPGFDLDLGHPVDCGVIAYRQEGGSDSGSDMAMDRWIPLQSPPSTPDSVTHRDDDRMPPKNVVTRVFSSGFSEPPKPRPVRIFRSPPSPALRGPGQPQPSRLRWNPMEKEFPKLNALYNYQVAAIQQRDYFTYPNGLPVPGPSTARKLWWEGGTLGNSFRAIRTKSVDSTLSTAARHLCHTKFESLLNIAVAILVTAHAVFVALETSYRFDPRIHESEVEYFRTTWRVLIVINSCFTFAYGVELVLRLANRGYRSLWGFDMQFAISIVACGVITDVLGWKTMRVSATVPRDVLQCFGVLRIFRILVDNSGGFCFRGISLAVRGLVFSLISLGWITFIMFVVLYSFANVATRVFTGPLEMISEEKMIFRWGSVSTSLYTLFLMLSFDGWSDVALETLDVFTLSPIFFVIFVAVSGVVLLNVVISVMVDSYLRASRALLTDEKYRTALQEEEKYHKRKRVHQREDKQQLTRCGSSTSCDSRRGVGPFESCEAGSSAEESLARRRSALLPVCKQVRNKSQQRAASSSSLCECCWFMRSNSGISGSRSVSLPTTSESPMKELEDTPTALACSAGEGKLQKKRPRERQRLHVVGCNSCVSRSM